MSDDFELRIANCELRIEEDLKLAEWRVRNNGKFNIGRG